MSAAPSWPRGRRGTVRGASPRTPERVVLAPSIQRCAGSFCPLFLASSVDCCVSRSSLTGWKVACCSIRANHIPSYTIWPFGEAESEWLFGMCQCVSDARCMPLVGRRIPRIGRCVGWEGGGMFCGVGGASGSIVEAGRAVRVSRAGEPCGRAVRASRAGWGGWSDGGVVPMWGCVSGDDGIDAVLSGLGCEGWVRSGALRCDRGGPARSFTVLKAFTCGAYDRPGCV